MGHVTSAQVKCSCSNCTAAAHPDLQKLETPSQHNIFGLVRRGSQHLCQVNQLAYCMHVSLRDWVIVIRVKIVTVSSVLSCTFHGTRRHVQYSGGIPGLISK